MGFCQNVTSAVRHASARCEREIWPFASGIVLPVGEYATNVTDAINSNTAAAVTLANKIARPKTRFLLGSNLLFKNQPVLKKMPPIPGVSVKKATIQREVPNSRNLAVFSQPTDTIKTANIQLVDR